MKKRSFAFAGCILLACIASGVEPEPFKVWSGAAHVDPDGATVHFTNGVQVTVLAGAVRSMSVRVSGHDRTSAGQPLDLRITLKDGELVANRIYMTRNPDKSIDIRGDTMRYVKSAGD